MNKKFLFIKEYLIAQGNARAAYRKDRRPQTVIVSFPFEISSNFLGFREQNPINTPGNALEGIFGHGSPRHRKCHCVKNKIGNFPMPCARQDWRPRGARCCPDASRSDLAPWQPETCTMFKLIRPHFHDFHSNSQNFYPKNLIRFLWFSGTNPFHVSLNSVK